MATISDLTFDLERFAVSANPPDVPLAFVVLDGLPAPGHELVLPPYPLIGMGERTKPGSELFDAIVESPVSAEVLRDQVLANPAAAASIVQLLRLIPDLEPTQALTAESMAYAMLQGSCEHRNWLDRQGLVETFPAGEVELCREADILTVTLDRPEAGNAIDRGMRDALFEAFALANADETVARIVLSGKGKAFSLGADLSEFGTTRDPATAHSIRCRTLPARQAWRCADRLEVQVQGACVGAGLELAAWAGRITARPNAWFQLPELAMGILPGAGGCVSLTRRIGRQRAALMILSGKRISANHALAWGLIDRIVDDAP